MDFHITIIDTEPVVVAAFQRVFADTPNVDVLWQNLRAIVNADCLVSPANSFGLMDGGVDAVIVRVLPGVDGTVQNEILDKYMGEQPVGTCLLVRSPRRAFRWLAHAPTMRAPEDVSDTDNAYTAFRALLICIIRHNKTAGPKDLISSVLCTPFCTGTGAMNPHVAAKQMHLAYTRVANPPTALSWSVVGETRRQLASAHAAAKK